MDADVVSEAFRTLQDGLCQTFSSVGGEQAFYEDEWRYGKGEGGGRTRVWSEAAGDEKTAPRPSGKWIGDASRRGLWTRAACSFSDIQGADLPAAALQVPGTAACMHAEHAKREISLTFLLLCRQRSSIRASRFRFGPRVCR